MKVIKVTFALAMAVSLILTAKTAAPSATGRASRFLQETESCRNFNNVCSSTVVGGRKATCCNWRCVDSGYDIFNCGACGKTCNIVLETCCAGECVQLLTDARHCGACHLSCMEGDSCRLGFCTPT